MCIISSWINILFVFEIETPKWTCFTSRTKERIGTNECLTQAFEPNEFQKEQTQNCQILKGRG